MVDYEDLQFDGLSFNDGIDFSIESGSFKFTPAPKRPQFVDNPDADGAALAYEPTYTNSEFTFSVRVVPQLSMDIALAKWGELNDLLQEAQSWRDKGGLPGVWTPAGSTRSYIPKMLLGEITDLPITPEGDLAGWFVASPVIGVKLTCRPFLYRPERTILVATSSSAPVQEEELLGVEGDVPAEGRLIATEEAAVDRRHLEWGLDKDSGAALITAAALTTAGFSGSITTRAGAYSAEKVVRATAIDSPTAICSTGDLPHIGSFRVKPRVWPTSKDARFRVSYRVGDGPFRSLPFVAAPDVDDYFEIDCGEVSLDEVEIGDQRSEIRIEQKSAGAIHDNDINYIELIPTTYGWGKARGLQSTQAPQLLAYDEFQQAEGPLDEPKALGSGEDWLEAVKTGANGFQIDPVLHRVTRSKVSDADLHSGCYALAGSATHTNAMVGVMVEVPGDHFVFGGVGNVFRGGVLLRYLDPENWLGAFVVSQVAFFSPWIELVVFKRVGGVEKLLGVTSIGGPSTPIFRCPMNLEATGTGTWQAFLGPGGNAFTVSPIVGQDDDLAAGGVLESGQAGMYDVWTSGLAASRGYSHFSVVGTPEPGRVCYSDRQAEVRGGGGDDFLRQDETGVFYGPPSQYRGGGLYVPPGDSRLVAKMRQNDVDTEADRRVTDKQGLEVKVSERFLAPR